jgi:hypothetical protein
VVATLLAFTTQPSGTTHLQTLTGTPVIEARDASGILDARFGGTVSLAISPSSSLTNNTATFISGRATFSGLTVSGSGTGRTLNASSGSIAGTSAGFDIAQAQAIVTLNNLTATYDGNTKDGGAMTDPTGLTVAFSYTDLSGTALSGPPAAPGNFNVTATVSDDNYQGSATATLVINKPALPTANFSVSAIDINPGQAVTFTNQSSGFITGNFLETGDGSNSVAVDAAFVGGGRCGQGSAGLRRVAGVGKWGDGADGDGAGGICIQRTGARAG